MTFDLKRTSKLLEVYDRLLEFDEAPEFVAKMEVFDAALRALAEEIGATYGYETRALNDPETCRQNIRPGPPYPPQGETQVSLLRRMVEEYREQNAVRPPAMALKPKDAVFTPSPKRSRDYDFEVPSRALVAASDGEGAVLEYTGGAIEYAMAEWVVGGLGDMGFDSAPDGLSIWEGIIAASTSYEGERDEWLEGKFRPLTRGEWFALSRGDSLFEASQFGQLTFGPEGGVVAWVTGAILGISRRRGLSPEDRSDLQTAVAPLIAAFNLQHPDARAIVDSAVGTDLGDSAPPKPEVDLKRAQTLLARMACVDADDFYAAHARAAADELEAAINATDAPLLAAATEPGKERQDG